MLQLWPLFAAGVIVAQLHNRYLNPYVMVSGNFVNSPLSKAFLNAISHPILLPCSIKTLNITLCYVIVVSISLQDPILVVI